MALIAWFPLNGTLNNYGVNKNITLTNVGAVSNSNGKIGSCYSFTTAQYMQINNLPYSNLTTCSISFWVYLDSNESWLPFTGQTTSYYILATSNNSGAFYHSQIGSSWSIYADGASSAYPKTAGAWHHYCITGVNLSTWTTFLLNKYGDNDQYGWNFTGRVNDLRIYDHNLSKQEIKENYNTLIVHYPLNDPYIESTTNISTQGNCSGWNNSGTATRTNDDTSIPNVPTRGKTVSITETTDGQCAITFGTSTINITSKTITASTWFWMTGDLTSVIQPYIRSTASDGSIGTLEYNGNSNINTWPKETWIRISKTITASSSETTCYFCAYTAKTGLKLVFNGWQIEEKDHATPYTPDQRDFKYDPQVYVEPDGSRWVRIVHHNNPKSYLFSSSSNWSAGVYVDSNRWFNVYSVVKKLSSYEFMIKQKTTSDATEVKYRWIQLKSPLYATYYDVQPSAITRITTSGYSTESSRGGIYILNSYSHMVITDGSPGDWYGAFGCWTEWSGGIPGYSTAVTTGYLDLYVRIDSMDYMKVVDASGLRNHGLICGALAVKDTTPRYDKSTYFDGTSYSTCVSPTSEAKTLSLWAYIGSSIPTYNVLFADYKSKLAFGFYSSGTQLIISCSGNTATVGSTSTIKLNSWNHFVAVKEPTNQAYVNGLPVTMSGGDAWTHTTDTLMLGKRSAGTGFAGQISDVRLYATAFSAADVLELYNTSGNIDKNGNSHFYIGSEEKKEVNVTKTGKITGGILEYDNTKLKTLSDGSVWVLLCHHNNPASNLFTASNCWCNNSTNLYSAMYLLKNTLWQSIDGYYEFLVCEKATSSSSELYCRFKQTSNPALSSTCTGYAFIDGTNVRTYGLMNKNSYGCIHNGNTWWCCVGSYTEFSGGIPGFTDTITTGYLDFYVRYPDTKMKGISQNSTNFYKDGLLCNQFIEF